MWTFNKSTGNDIPPACGSGQTSQQKRRVWIWIERVLLALGIILLGVYAAARIESFFASRAALERFAAIESSVDIANPQDAGETSSPTEATEHLDLPEVNFSLWDQRRVQAYEQSLNAESCTPMAVLRISKIHLEAPVFDGTDDLTLNHAVGRIAGTAWPGGRGNIGIAGHRDGFFRGLKDVGVGDAIELKTPKGTDTYIVDRVQIVTPDNVGVLRPRSVPSLTLITCYPFYVVGSAPQRYIVTASLAREIKGGSGNSQLDSLSHTAVQKGEKQ